MLWCPLTRRNRPIAEDVGPRPPSDAEKREGKRRVLYRFISNACINDDAAHGQPAGDLETPARGNLLLRRGQEMLGGVECSIVLLEGSDFGGIGCERVSRANCWGTK